MVRSSIAAFTALTLSFASICLAHLQEPRAASAGRALHNNKRHAAYLARRQAGGAQTTSQPTFTIPTPTQVPGMTIPALTDIKSGMPTETPATMFTTFAPGATPAISGAPPLPSGELIFFFQLFGRLASYTIASTNPSPFRTL